MSNYATFDADITLSSVLDVEATAEKAKQAFCVSDVSVSQVTDDTFELWFGENADYRDDDIHAFLQEIQPHTVSGYVTYRGESGDHWRNIFDILSNFAANVSFADSEKLIDRLYVLFPITTVCFMSLLHKVE